MRLAMRIRANSRITLFHICGCGCGGHNTPGFRLYGHALTWLWHKWECVNVAKHHPQKSCPHAHAKAEQPSKSGIRIPHPCLGHLGGISCSAMSRTSCAAIYRVTIAYDTKIEQQERTNFDFVGVIGLQPLNFILSFAQFFRDRIPCFHDSRISS